MDINRNQADDEPIDEGDEHRVGSLLTATQHTPAMRGEFRRALGERLDAEFAALCPPTLPFEAADASAIGSTQVDAPKAATPRRRWKLGAAIAASLVGVVAVWSDPPAWAHNMIRGIVARIEALAGVDVAKQAEDRPAPQAVVVESSPASEAKDSNATAPTKVVIPEVVVVAEEEPRDSTETASTRPASQEPPKHVVAPLWKPFDAPLPAGQLGQRVDELLAKHWQSSGIQPVELADDAEFMRRVYLDLTGRVPSVSEARAFLEDKSPYRREQLIDRLLAHRDHATHLAAARRGILLPEEVDLTRLGGAAKFDEWLAERFAVNKPYNKIVQDLLLAEGRVAESGPLLFYAAVKLNPEELAARTSRAFLGVRMECAQCHDHPFEETVTQNDFWSFAAFFARISRPEGKMEMTSPVLQVRDSQHGEVKIPESDEIVPPRLPMTASALADAEDGPSRRRQMVDWLTAKDNGQFARASVNRVWAHLFGRGLVEPVDDMRPANAPICPEVLETLSRDFAASGYDLRRLLAELTSTKAYQLSSRSTDDDPARALNFAQMNIKSFTAEQLYDCIAVAAGQGAATATAGAAGSVSEVGLLRGADLNRQAFIQQFRAPPGQATNYHAGIPQALTLMHGGLITSATDVARSSLLKSIQAPFFTNEQRLEALFLAALSRYPEPAEREAVLAQLANAEGDGDRRLIMGDVLWALLNCAEFTLNH